MKKEKKELTLRQELRIRSIKILAMLLLVIAGIKVYHYLTEYYPADNVAKAVYEEGSAKGSIYTIGEKDKSLILKADEPNGTGIIFYPGGKVEYIAYLPMLEQLREAGYDVILTKMPFNLAFFDMDAANEHLENMKTDLPDVKTWYIMGHSLGGVAASAYAADHEDTVSGLILLGSYDYKNYDPTNTLIIYGSNDVNLKLEKIDYDKSEVLCIDGGNHAWFGNYGVQEGDGKATISHEEQQTIAVEKIIDWMN